MLPDPNADLLGWLKATGDDGWLTTGEAAGLLGITPRRLCQLRRVGRTPRRASGRPDRQHILWAVTEVERWAAEHEPSRDTQRSVTHILVT